MTTLCWSWATMLMSHIDVSVTSCNFHIGSDLVLVFGRSSLEWTVQFSVHVQLTKKNKQRKAIQNDSNLGYRTSEVNVTPTHYPRRHTDMCNFLRYWIIIHFGDAIRAQTSHVITDQQPEIDRGREREGTNEVIISAHLFIFVLHHWVVSLRIRTPRNNCAVAINIKETLIKIFKVLWLFLIKL